MKHEKNSDSFGGGFMCCLLFWLCTVSRTAGAEQSPCGHANSRTGAKPVFDGSTNAGSCPDLNTHSNADQGAAAAGGFGDRH